MCLVSVCLDFAIAVRHRDFVSFESIVVVVDSASGLVIKGLLLARSSAIEYQIIQI